MRAQIFENPKVSVRQVSSEESDSKFWNSNFGKLKAAVKTAAGIQREHQELAKRTA
jgi:hypothetical protein